MTRIVVASDHAAYEAKAALAAHLRAAGHEVLDVGTDGLASVDYPDFGAKGADARARRPAARDARHASCTASAVSTAAPG